MREREALERYLEQLEQSAEPDEVVIAPRAVASALEKLHRHSEPEVGFRRTTQGFMAAYNVPAAVDAEPALLVAQPVTLQAGDNGSLQPLAEAAQAATGGPAQRRASCRRCLPTVACTVAEMARCSTARNLRTNRRATGSCARPGRLSLANNECGKIVPCAMQHNPKSAEPAL